MESRQSNIIMYMTIFKYTSEKPRKVMSCLISVKFCLHGVPIKSSKANAVLLKSVRLYHCGYLD